MAIGIVPKMQPNSRYGAINMNKSNSFLFGKYDLKSRQCIAVENENSPTVNNKNPRRDNLITLIA
jgi:hypothetical protein